ncbi:MAG: DUF6134 family protein [Cryomorphaceae bacterium]
MKSTLFVCFLLISYLLQGQVMESHYKIMSDDDEVGHLLASKKEDGNIIKYEISSDVSIRILFKIQMTNEIQAVFKNGILVYSSATLYLNGKVYSDTKIEKEDGFYRVEKDGHETKIYSGAIRSSSAKLYFKEPIGEATSLSETEGEMKEVDLQGVRKYALTENGNSRSVSTYIYSADEGVLERITLVRPYVPELHIFRK